MRFFELLNIQHVFLYIFPTLIFMLLLWLALGYRHFYTRHWRQRLEKIYSRYPEDLEDRDAPFPLAMTLIIVGTVIWALGYIFFHGILEVKI